MDLWVHISWTNTIRQHHWRVKWYIYMERSSPFSTPTPTMSFGVVPAPILFGPAFWLLNMFQTYHRGQTDPSLKVLPSKIMLCFCWQGTSTPWLRRIVLVTVPFFKYCLGYCSLGCGISDFR
jgi:hypothetical protein